MLDALPVQSLSPPGEAAPSKTAACRLMLQKKLSQPTKPSEVKESVADLQLAQRLCGDFQPGLDGFDLAPVGIRYYSQSMLKSEIFRVTRRADDEDHHRILGARSVQIQHRAAPILKALAWQGKAGAETLLKAIQYFKATVVAVDSMAP